MLFLNWNFVFPILILNIYWVVLISFCKSWGRERETGFDYASVIYNKHLFRLHNRHVTSPGAPDAPSPVQSAPILHSPLPRFFLSELVHYSGHCPRNTRPEKSSNASFHPCPRAVRVVRRYPIGGYQEMRLTTPGSHTAWLWFQHRWTRGVFGDIPYDALIGLLDPLADSEGVLDRITFSLFLILGSSSNVSWLDTSNTVGFFNISSLLVQLPSLGNGPSLSSSEADTIQLSWVLEHSERPDRHLTGCWDASWGINHGDKSRGLP